jgi:CelD/BcsL family acetyltransferase involved in cellulose biosynthesis
VRSSVRSTGKTQPASLKVSIYNADDWHKVADQWATLETLSPYRSFYLSADWITAWLKVFGKSVQPRIVIFEEGRQTVGACLLTQSVERSGPFQVRRVGLNTGGEPVEERTLVEFNNILCRPGKENAVAQALGKYLQSLAWDEFAISGMSAGKMLTALQTNAFPKHPALVTVRSTFYIDLDELRQKEVRYLDTLSSNTRSQIRRSLKGYLNFGELKVEIAQDSNTAELFFEEMCKLHQSRWAARGQPGAFAADRVRQFHKTLIREAYHKQKLHLLRVSAGNKTVGILYNFVQDRKVCFFQSGFNYALAPKLKPGLVTHACAIQKYLDSGFAQYDFLVGEARYKTSLAKSCGSLAWVTFGRPNVKLAVIELLRVIKRSVKRNGLASPGPRQVEK